MTNVAKVKFSQLPPAEDTDIQDSDIIPLVNIDTSKKVTFANFKEYLVGNGFVVEELLNSTVSSAIENLIDGAPEYLDTLKELADAINNDGSFSNTIRDLIEESVANSFQGKTTDDLQEGSVNLYFTAGIADAHFDEKFAGKTTTHLEEGDNLYFTEQRVLDAIGGPVVSNADLDTLAPGDTYFSQTSDTVSMGMFAAQNITAGPNGIQIAGTGGVTIMGVIGSAVNLGGQTSGPINFNSVTSGINYNDLTNQPTIPTDINQLSDADGLLGGGSGELPTDPEFDSVTATTLNVQDVNFTGTGAVNIVSGSDINLSATGWITFSSLPRLPNYTIAQLNDLSGVPVGAFAFCTDLTQPAPVYYDGAVWRDMINNDINGSPDDFSAPLV